MGEIQHTKETDNKQSVLDAIEANTNCGFLWLDNNEEGIWQAIANMSLEEQERYRTDRKFKAELDEALDDSLDKGTEREIAQNLLSKVAVGKEPKFTIVERVAMYSTQWFVDEAKLVGELEQVFRNDKLFHLRVSQPKSRDDMWLSKNLQKHLRNALGRSDYQRYGVPLIQNGWLSEQAHRELE